MSSHIQSILVVGSSGIVIEIECQLSNSLPSMIIVGLGSKAVDEAKERIRSAFASTRLALPRKRIIINLAPADVPKESTSLDLAIAAAILAASGQTRKPVSKQSALIGEVGLNGDVRPVRGIIGKLVAAKQLGITTFIIPLENLQQAQLVPDVTLMPVENVRQLYEYLNNTLSLPAYTYAAANPLPENPVRYEHSLSFVTGQQLAKRALEIAAAGGHNVLLSGPPGTGKSMLAKALPSILPPLSHQEILEVTHLHSLANNDYDQLITNRPFRAPHHSSSHVSVVGGGNNARPGEVTLSHRGVLFLDEVPEFNRVTLEALRQPLEDRHITVARARQTVTYPAHFILVATANPCPCGFYGSSKPCQCTPHQILHYQQKLSGPILDRIDLFAEADMVEHAQLLTSAADSATDDTVRMRIAAARQRQSHRYKSDERLNTEMTNKEIRSLAQLEDSAVTVLNKAAEQLDISARSYMRLVKVARTIADLENSPTICVPHISEAIQYRSLRSLNR